MLNGLVVEKEIILYHWFINRAAFEKEIEGMPSARVIGDFPPELRCPLCKQGMKDAVLTSKCCFTSFCDKCKIMFNYSYFYFLLVLFFILLIARGNVNAKAIAECL